MQAKVLFECAEGHLDISVMGSAGVVQWREASHSFQLISRTNIAMIGWFSSRWVGLLVVFLSAQTRQLSSGHAHTTPREVDERTKKKREHVLFALAIF